MSRRAQENVVAGIVLLVFVAALVISFDYGPRARLVPVPIATLGIILTVLQIFWQNWRSADELRVDALELFTSRQTAARPRPEARPEATKAKPAAPAPPLLGWWRRLNPEVAAFAVVAAIVVLFLVLGPIPAVLVFSAGYFILSRHYTWARGLAYALLCTAIIYGLFGVILDVDLNRGWAMPWINQFVRF